MINKTIVLSAAIFVLVYNLLFFQTGFGIGTGFLVLAFNLYFFITRDQKIQNTLFALTSSAAAVLFAFLYAFRSNNIVQGVDFIAAAFFSLVAFALYKYPGRISWQIPEFLLMPFEAIKNLLVGVRQLFKKDSWPSGNMHSSTVPALLRGVAILMPVLIVLLVLLVKADPVFGKLTRDFLSQVGERTIITFVLFISLLSFGISKFIEKSTGEEVKSTVSEGKAHELAVVSGGVLLLFAAFIAVQFRYLFSGVGERDLMQLGIKSLTYSEYVRKGFFELLIAAVVACGVISYMLRFLHRLESGQKLLVQAFSGILTVETGFLLFSAFKRLSLYADAHGLTRARIFGFIFLVWLAMLLVIFLVRALKPMKKEWFFGATSATVIAALVFINVINIDGLIATKYVPTVNGEIDYYYLTALSPDAYQSWRPALEDVDRVLTQLERTQDITTEDNRRLNWAFFTLANLRTHTGYLVFKYDRIKWQALNISEYNAYKAILKNSGFSSKLTILQSRANAINGRVREDVKHDTPFDRSTQPPLM